MLKREGPQEFALTAGLGALPWIEDALRAAAPEDPPRRDLELLADRLCNIVRDVVLDTQGWKASDALEATAAALNGKNLDAEGVIGLVRASAEAPPTGCGRIDLCADRIGDGTGITIVLRVVPLPGERGTSVGHSYSVIAAGRSLGNSSGSGTHDAFFGPDAFKDERRNVRDGLALAHHDQMVEIEMGYHLP